MDKRAKEVVLRTAITNLQIQQASIDRLLTGGRGESKLYQAVARMKMAEKLLGDWAAKNDIPIRPMRT
jgi:hypothetical protein